jgi:hypothetical protein
MESHPMSGAGDEGVQEGMIDTRWCDRSTQEWALRYEGRICKLMMRYADSDGLDSGGHEAPWGDVATIHDAFWADTLLRKLRG